MVKPKEAVCGECGSGFTPTKKQRENAAAGKAVYCSSPCLHLSRGRHSRARWANGVMPAWGSPAQVAARDKLVEYNRARNITGPAHPQWKSGKWSNEAKAERRTAWEKEKERRASVPAKVPCMVCGTGFALSSAQRHLWYRHGANKGYCCSMCVGNEQIVKVPPHYYAPAVCSRCSVRFAPNENQRAHRYKNPDASIYCSDICLTKARAAQLAPYHGVMEGPTHPSWKGGGWSKQVVEAQQFRTKIKRFIKEGVIT